MSEPQAVHPDHAQLEAYGLGLLDPEEAAEVEHHVATCAGCCQVLQAVPDDTYVSLVRDSATVLDAPPDSGEDSGPLPNGVAAVPPTLDTDGGTIGYQRSGTTGETSAAAPEDHSGATTGVKGLSPASAGGVSNAPTVLLDHPRYRILGLLGAGGMGAVYRAEHRLMGRLVALKVIGRGLVERPDMVERFRREVQAAARLAHPNIVTAYDAEQAGDTHFLVMEFVEGTSLDRLVQARGPLPVAEACDYVRQAALGLEHAHRRGMVHRDIKPQNLMRTPDGQVKVLDFGLAHFVSETVPAGVLTEAGTIMGTPDYIAPEQARDAHAADIRADVYSLGCTLYYLLAGHPPFPEGGYTQKLAAHLERTPRSLSELRGDVPVELVQVVERMMAKDPARRYQTPREVADALAPFVGLRLNAEFAGSSAPTVVPPPPAGKLLRGPQVTVQTAPTLGPQPETKQTPAQPPRRGRSWRALVGGLGGAAFVAGLVLFLSHGPGENVRERLDELYMICAVLGGTLLVCQFLLSLVGVGHHHDFGGHDVHDVGHSHAEGGHEAESSWFVNLLTFRTIVAALVFFGLAGRAADEAEADPGVSLVIALGAGAGALFLVGWVMRSLSRLRAEGTVRIHRAVGQSGTVYLPIPGQRAGLGKVLLNVQNRTVEYQAVTPHETLPTGARVTVLSVVSPDTVEVVLTNPTLRSSHA